MAIALTVTDLALASGVAFWLWLFAAGAATAWVWRALERDGWFPAGSGSRERLLLAEEVVRTRLGPPLIAIATLGAALTLAIRLD